MNIIAEQVTGTVWVVASNEVHALEAFGNGDTHDDLVAALNHEGYRNEVRMRDDEPVMNTYKIAVTAERVH